MDDITRALEGDAEALQRLVRAIQPMVGRLALRFFGCPEHAQDATQEVLIQVITRLDRFAGDSTFTTWVYRVATNKFLSMTRSRAERAALSFEAFAEELAEVPPAEATGWPVEQALLLEEVKIGCTLAMLLCLERDARMAYILGAIAELDHEVAAEILEIAPATYRKRLQRAREALTDLMRARCGLFDAHNPCRCSRRVGRAVERGRMDPHHLVFATSAEQARRFPAVLGEIRQLEELERAAALYRSHPDPQARDDLAERLREMLQGWSIETSQLPSA
jgi:RNA polymerase sigma factor (sigma-70 family)